MVVMVVLGVSTRVWLDQLDCRGVRGDVTSHMSDTMMSSIIRITMMTSRWVHLRDQVHSY